ncbi:MAG: non-canonical purine NTP pyrophosphatase [Cyanobium sp.]
MSRHASPPLPGQRSVSRVDCCNGDSPILVIASGNPHKVEEIARMLDAVGLQVACQPRDLEIEETGDTYLANARLKAETVAARTGCWALADDSGIEVDALDGRPGLFSARYAPTDHERIQRLLDELGDSPYRGASFVSAMALASPEGITVAESEGICRGLVLRTPQGQGPGYDPIFYVREAGSSYAQLNAHQKSRFGSRGRAAREMAPRLRNHLRLDG